MTYEIDKQTSDTINIVKFIAIILVCYLHSYKDGLNFNGYTVTFEIPLWFEIIRYSIAKIIGPIAVPSFFFLSALLIYRKNIIWKDVLKKKLKTLLFPYMIMNTIGIASFFVLQHIPSLSLFFSKPENIISNWQIMDWVNAYIGYRDGYPMLYPLWFIRNLIILNIFCIPIKFFIKKYNLTFIIILLMLYLFSNLTYINANIILFEKSVLYWSLGCFCCINNIKFKTIANFVEKYYILLIYIICCIASYVMHHSNIMFSDVINKITIFMGVFVLLSIVYNIKNIHIKDKLLKLAPYTFSIYLFHEFSLTFFRKLLGAVLPSTINYIALEYILCPLVIIIYCIILSIFLKKICPKLYSIITGGRT